MASTTWILSFCMLLSAVPFSTGITFNINRSPGGPFCAYVDCLHDAGGQQKGGKFAIKKISLYEIKDRNKYVLASQSAGDNSMFVDPTKVLDINGTSSVSDFNAELRLNLHNPTDCLYRTLQCEVEYVDASGKRQVVRKTITPTAPNVNDDCSCSSITYKLETLKNRAEGASRQANGLTMNFDNIKIQISSVQNGTKDLAELIARIRESHENLLVATAEAREGDREIGTNLNALRDTDNVLETGFDDVRQLLQDLQDDINNLEENDKNTEKKLHEYGRYDRAFFELLSALTRADAYFEGVIISSQKVDADHQQRLNDLEKESSSLANQEVQLVETDQDLIANIVDLSARQAELRTSTAEAKSIDMAIDRDDDSLEAENRNLQEVAAELKRATENQQEEIIEISEALSELEAQGGTLKGNDDSIDVKLQGLQSIDSGFEAILRELEAESISYDQRRDGLDETNRVHQAKVDSIRKTDTAHKMDVSDMTAYDQILIERLRQIDSNNSAFANAIAQIESLQDDTFDGLDIAMNKMLVIGNQVSTAAVTTVSKTTSSLVLSSCTRNMPHDSTRAAIVLDGEHTVLCDTVTAGGGYVILLSRHEGDVDFYRPWADYKKGFGIPPHDYYIGLNAMANLIDQGFTDLRIDMLDKNGKPFFAQYSVRMEKEDAKYRAFFSDYHGTAPDSLSYHSGHPFSTYDQDHDSSPGNCAIKSGGGNWFDDCYEANLFGVLGATGENGLNWKGIGQLSFLELKVRK